MLKQTILCSSSEFPPSSSFLVSRHDFKSKWSSENIWKISEYRLKVDINDLTWLCNTLSNVLLDLRLVVFFPRQRPPWLCPIWLPAAKDCRQMGSTIIFYQSKILFQPKLLFSSIETIFSVCTVYTYEKLHGHNGDKRSYTLAFLATSDQ